MGEFSTITLALPYPVSKATYCTKTIELTYNSEEEIIATALFYAPKACSGKDCRATEVKG